MDTSPPQLGPISFIFKQFSGINWLNNNLAPHLEGWPPGLGNPGFSTGLCGFLNCKAVSDFVRTVEIQIHIVKS